MLNLKRLYWNGKKFLNRILKPVRFGELSLKPISREFGLDRGTPVDRYYIEHFLSHNRKYISGKLLEVADDTYIRKYGHIGSEYNILSYENECFRDNIIVGDLTKPNTLENLNINCFVCTQTLNFIFDVKMAIEGIYKCLAPGGVALVTVAGISQISRYDYNRWGDFWRFTDMSIKKLFIDIFGNNNVRVSTYGNLFASKALLDGICIEDLSSVDVLKKRDKDYQCLITLIARKTLK